MKMIFQEFKDRWNSIVARSNCFLSAGIIHPLNLQMGYYSSMYKSFIIMDTGVVPDIPSSFAIKAVNTQLQNGSWILEFQLIHHSFEEEFLRLCWDMIETTQKSEAPLKEIILRYLSWQKFLQYSTRDIMSFQKQKGLLGELIFLKECIEKMGCEASVSSWNGPDGSDQDFLFQNSWAEVKTIALASEKIGISSLQQLEQEVDGILVVNILEKSTTGDGRITLSEVVSELRNSMKESGKVLDGFEMKLFKYGYRDSDVAEYKKNYFRFIEQRTYLVDERFPRLVRSNVATEVVSCKYDISLSAIEKYRRG